MNENAPAVHLRRLAGAKILKQYKDIKTIPIMKVFAVTTNGGQIENDQTPQAVEVPTFLIPFVKESFKKYGFVADDFANYYPTINSAKHAIDWALYN